MYKLTFYLLLLSCPFAFAACHKNIPEGKMEGQIALTFDDNSVENWYAHLPLLDSLHIKATFYISSYHTFTKHQKLLLRDIEMHGHEIGYHTATHIDLAKEAAKKGMAQVEEREIKSDLRLMKADGFYINNFAYPYGSHTSQLNTCLLRTFKSVRALSNKNNYYKSLIRQTGDWQVFYAAGIDNNSRLKKEGIKELINNAQKHHDCLILVAHQIDNNTVKLQVTRERLKFIARAAAEKNLEFITVNQIAR